MKLGDESQKNIAMKVSAANSCTQAIVNVQEALAQSTARFSAIAEAARVSAKKELGKYSAIAIALEQNNSSASLQRYRELAGKTAEFLSQNAAVLQYQEQFRSKFHADVEACKEKLAVTRWGNLTIDEINQKAAEVLESCELQESAQTLQALLNTTGDVTSKQIEKDLPQIYHLNETLSSSVIAIQDSVNEGFDKNASLTEKNTRKIGELIQVTEKLLTVSQTNYEASKLNARNSTHLSWFAIGIASAGIIAQVVFSWRAEKNDKTGELIEVVKKSHPWREQQISAEDAKNVSVAFHVITEALQKNVQLEKETDRLQTDLSKAQNNLAALQKQYDAFTATCLQEKQKLYSEITALKKQIEELKTELAKRPLRKQSPEVVK